MPSSIHAFDLSLTATGYCGYLEHVEDMPRSLFPPFRSKRQADDAYYSQQRLAHILKCLRESVVADGSFVVLEGYAFTRANQAHQLGELGGLVRYWLWMSNIPWIDVGPNVLKQFVTGKGNSQKSEMMKCVYQRFHVDCSDDNIADAVGLCMIGRALHGLWEPTTIIQKQIIEDLRKKYAPILAAA
jgi:Holliday junction resolvasome RuvABC endonuclease subunit